VLWELQSYGEWVEALEYEASLPVDDTLFIRFGSVPKRGQSRNHVSGELESGVSVYAAIEQDGSIRYDDNQSLNRPYSMLFFLERPAYLVRGYQLNRRGSDGEPLLVNVQVVCHLRYNKKTGSFERVGSLCQSDVPRKK